MQTLRTRMIGMKPHPRRLFLALFICLLPAQACVSMPSERVETPYGTVCAEDLKEAKATASLLAELAPAVLAVDSSFRPRPVEVWMLDQVGSEYLYGGFDSAGRILLEIVPHFRRSSLAHELVHAFEGPEWASLPAVMQEGLADWVAARVAPEEGPALRANRAVSLASYVGSGLRIPVVMDDRREVCFILRVAFPEALTVDEALRVPHNQIQSAGTGKFMQALYGLGLFLCSRIGLENLLDLSRRAERGGLDLIPPEWIYEAARLDPDPSTWAEAVQDFISGQEEQRVLRRIIGFGDEGA